MVNWDDLRSDDLHAKTIEHAIQVLDKLPIGTMISTQELMGLLYPKERAVYAVQEFVRNKMFKAILAETAKALHAYCTKGNVQGEFMGRPKRPWLWHAPKQLKTCEHCGSEYFSK